MGISVGLDAVMLCVSDEIPRVLTVATGDLDVQLPSGPLDPVIDSTLDRAVRRWVLDQAALEAGFVEQLHTFGDGNRDPRSRITGDRMISIVYLAMVTETTPSKGAEWADLYDFLPWEDHRESRPSIIADQIEPVLDGWAEASTSAEVRAARRDRARIAFGLWGADWDGTRAVDRFGLLHEAGLAEEAKRDGGAQPGISVLDSRAMAFDHRRILATALAHLRDMMRLRPAVFELTPGDFTLRDLQRLVEAVVGERLHTQTFRRLLEKGGLVEGTGDHVNTGGRPAELYRFRREVLAERPRPGAIVG